MEATLGRAGANEVVGEEEGLEDGEERKKQSDGSLALQQIGALLRRNAINRRRTKVTSFCELCSPVLLLCVLVFGYTLSDVLVFPEEIYSSVNLDLPGGFGGLLPLARLYGQGLANATLPSVNSSSLAGVTPGVAGGGDQDREGDGGDEELLSFDDVKRVFRDVTDLMDGPFPVPDLDAFVGLGSAVAGDLGDGAYAQIVDSMESGWIFGNIITQGTLHFAPARDPAVGELVSWLSKTTKGFDILTHRVHETEDDAVAYALDHLEERTWAVIALEEAVEGRVDYTIRMNFTVVPNTNTVVDMIAIGLDPSFRSYYLSGFLTLQTTLDRFMFKRALPGAPAGDQSEESSEEGFACVPPDVIGVPFPTAAYDQNLFYAAVGYLLGLAMTMSTMYPLSRLVKGVVEEKESRVRETMRIMGLHAWTHELSWLATGAAVFAFIAISVSALLSWTFLPLADGSLLLVFMLSFTLSEVGMALLVSSFFSKAKLASIAAPCVLFAGVLPRYIFYGSNRHEAPRSKTLASLLSPTAFTFGADFIADYEYANIGAGWGNYAEGEYSLQTSINMMFIDAVLYGVLAWYLDKVVPPEYGTSRDPLKFLTSLPQVLLKWVTSRWRRFSPGSSRRWAAVNTTDDNDTEGDSGGVVLEEAGIIEGVGVEGDPADFEPLGERGGGKQGVVIAGLRKEFGSKVAVAGLDLRLLPGDITCLLGHNGAGKSTTISMLTGQLGATSGDAVVWGHSVRDSLHKVRQNIGICPQHDALMPLLTAREHLEMYMDIKGMRQDMKGPLVTKKLREVGLLEKEHTWSSNLSGGQKRKLSVALALTGSPTLCILDEPTSGMDPYSRRFTWDLLRRGRAGRCTLLSTHFMEEAEHLGDRVAMLRKGKLRCVGSPLFLKSRFGLGYKLTLVKAGVSFDPDSLTSLVLSHVSNAEVLSSAGGEISFRLPREESGKFPGLFRDLEAGREAMGIGGYGVSITSLEEVFLSLEREGKLADSGGGARNTGFGGGFGGESGGREEGGGGTVLDASRRNGTIDAASGGSSSSSRSSAGGLQGAGKLRQRRDSRKGGGGGGGGGAGPGTPSKGKSSAGEWWGETRTEQVREIEMHSLAAASRPTISSNNLDVVGPIADARETANGADIGRNGTSVCNGNGQVSTNGNQVSADIGRNGTSACNGRLSTNGNPASGSNSGGGSSHKGGMDESYNSSSRFAHDEEDRAALLAEGQEDDQDPPPTIAPDCRENDTVAGWGRRERNLGAEAAGIAEDRAPRQPWSSPMGWKGAVSRFWQQLCWLLWKRKVVAARDWRGGVYQVVLPAALVALVLVLLTIDVGLAGPSLAMSAAMFGNPTEVLYATGHGGGPGTKVAANVAKATDTWTHLNPDNKQSGLSVPTSSGLSRFLLDTYNNIGEDEAAELASANEAGTGDNTRPPRYGAFVFGDRFPVNVTVDWDELRERPELLAESLKVLSEALPDEGGEFDLKGLMEATGVDEHDLARAVLQRSDGLNGRLNGQDGNDTLGFLPPQNNGTPGDNGLDYFGGNYSWITTNNWTQGWFDLVDEDPTVRFTDAEYLPQSSELKLEGVVLSAEVDNKTQTMELGEVVLSVDDMLDAVPPGTRRYDKGMLPAPNGTTSTVMFNTTAPHSLPAWLGELTAKTFEACGTQRGLESEKMSYTTRSHPLPLTATESLEVQTMLSLLVSLLVTIPLCYAPAAFVTFLVRERACKSKRVQLVSGASPLAYWLSSYLWDSLLFFVLTVLVMLAFAAYGADASKVFMMHWDALLGTWGLLISYGLSALPLSYLYSFAFDGPSSAQISIAGVNFLSGFGFVIAYAVLASLKKTVRFAEKAQHFFRLFPPYLLGDGLIKVSSEFYMREVLGINREWGVLAWDVAGKAICYMCLEAVGYLTLVLVVEYSLAAGVRGKADRLRLRLGGWSDGDLAKMLAESKGPSEDCDVKEERLRVDEAMARAREGSRGGVAPAGVGEAGGVEADTVSIRGLTKVYPAPMSTAQQRPKCAVRGLSLGIKRGECFGLLGINGAGKSTTLQILTRDLQATSGNLRVEGKPITSSAVSRLLGYCPQMDPLLPLMTVNETLLFFGGLKDIHSRRARHVPQAAAAAAAAAGTCMGGAALQTEQTEVLQRAAAAALSAVSLGSMENQLAGTLSGGNKRKLSLAVALIGGPPVLLLDEPSSGMDPGARRSMWEVISSLSASHSVILTTHSMEECEAVCDRLGIMVGGRLRCLGTSQHLKGRFGGGYSIEVRCPTASMPQVSAMIRGLSPLARLEEMHPTLAKFSIPAGGEMTSDSLDAGHSGSGGRLGGDERRQSWEGLNGLSLSKAFETIEARKAELEVWDYSISQATLETIFMSFAKNQEEEVASVPGVTYTDTTTLNDANHDTPTPAGTGENSSEGTRPDAHHGAQGPPRAPRMDVEMGWMGESRSRREKSSNESVEDEGESAAFV